MTSNARPQGCVRGWESSSIPDAVARSATASIGCVVPTNRRMPAPLWRPAAFAPVVLVRPIRACPARIMTPTKQVVVLPRLVDGEAEPLEESDAASQVVDRKRGCKAAGL